MQVVQVRQQAVAKRKENRHAVALDCDQVQGYYVMDSNSCVGIFLVIVTMNVLVFINCQLIRNAI